MTEHETETEQSDEQHERQDLHELMVRGNEYRATKEFDFLGEKTDVIMKPMIDEHSIPLTAALHAMFDMEVEDAREEVEEARDDEGTIDVRKLDDKFVGLMRRAARYSIDREANGWSEAQFNDIVGSDPTDPSVPEKKSKSVGGMIVDLGMEGFELAGTLEDAKIFRGRGTQ